MASSRSNDGPRLAVRQQFDHFVLNESIAGHDLARKQIERQTVRHGYLPACLRHQQTAGGDIPRIDLGLPITIAVARRIRYTGSRSGPCAGDYEQGEAYPSHWDTTDEWCQAEALLDLARYLPEHKQKRVLHEALQIVQSIEDKDERANALAALAPQLPAALRQTMLLEILRETRQILHENDRSVALKKLAPCLQTTDMPEAFDAAKL